MGKRSPSRRIPHRSRAIAFNAIALLVAVAALFHSIALGVGPRLVDDAHSLMGDAAVSLNASVPPNPYNTLADQLAAEKTQLDNRAATLNAQQAGFSSPNKIQVWMTIASFCMSLVLLFLVGLNFYLDMRRRRGQVPGLLERKFLVDLR